MKSFIRKPALFWTFWSFDALVASGFLYFFFLGLADGSVSSFNIILWLGILGFLTAILSLPLWLKHLGYPVIALGVLLVVALPSFLSLLFFLAVLISHPRWN